MAVWFEVEKSKNGIENFLDSNWGFHDFRIEKIEYVPGKDMVEIFFKYDTMDHGVLLRFVRVHDMHISIQKDYEDDWIMGSTVLILDDGSLIWLDDDWWGKESKEHLDELKTHTTWIESEQIFWAITDANGNPVEMPYERIHQVWVCYGKQEEKHFEFKEFSGNWENILHSY